MSGRHKVRTEPEVRQRPKRGNFGGELRESTPDHPAGESPRIGNEFDQIATAAFDKVIRHELLRPFALSPLTRGEGDQPQQLALTARSNGPKLLVEFSSGGQGEGAFHATR